jgi:chromate transport protein ChrA
MGRIWRIAKLGFWLGATVFGGVAAAYPRVRERAAELGDITGEEVDGLYALAVLLPGPSFLNLVGAVSGRAGGMIGALVGQVALLLPGFVLVMLLPMLLRISYFSTHSNGALNGAIWSTAGLLLATGIDQVRKLKSHMQRAAVFLVLAALLLGAHPTVMLVLVIGGGALAGSILAQKKAA